MNSFSLRRSNIGLALAIIVLAVYVAILLVNNYISQTRFIDASQKRFLYVLEKQAMAISYFFTERRQDLWELSNSKEVCAYFENKALGMSAQYGLATSLMEMQRHFDLLSDSRKIGGDLIYGWIAFVTPDGVPITGISHNGASAESCKQIPLMGTKSMYIMIEKKENNRHAIITIPYVFKNQLKGHIAAEVPLGPILNNFVDVKNISQNSRAYFFCSEFNLLFPEDGNIPTKQISDIVEKNETGSGIFRLTWPVDSKNKSALIYAPISNTPLSLINVLPEDELFSGIKPRDSMLAMLLLFLLISGGFGLFVRSNLQKRLISNRFKESMRNAQEFEQQNEKLSLEIAVRKKMEKKLETMNKELKETGVTLNHILKSATEFAIAAVDSQYRIIHFNPAAERILDVKADEVMGQTVLNIHALRNVKTDRFETGIAVAQKEGKYEYDIIRENSDGIKYQRLHAVVMPMRDVGGNIVGYIFFAVDTTKQYEFAEKLRLSEERYRTLVENMPDIVFSVDARLIIQDINLPKIQTYGLKTEHIIEKPFDRFIHPDDRASILKLAHKDIKVRETVRRGLRFRIDSGDNGIHWVDLNLHYQYDNDGAYLKANGVLRDISEQKLLEKQLIRTERLAAAGQLAASIAHEINSPLAGISALLGLVHQKNLGDTEALELIELIRKAFEDIGHIVQNLLDLCRPSLSSMQKANLNTIIQGTVALSKAYVKKKGISIIVDLSPAVPAFDCYPQELGQVFLNFINNTIEALDIDSGGDGKEPVAGPPLPKEIWFRTKAVSDKIVVEYFDTGPGIAEKDLDRLFDPFFTRKKTFGLGVGLSICHDIITRHNGTIQALPAKVGAHFMIEFLVPRQEISPMGIPKR